MYCHKHIAGRFGQIFVVSFAMIAAFFIFQSQSAWAWEFDSGHAACTAPVQAKPLNLLIKLDDSSAMTSYWNDAAFIAEVFADAANYPDDPDDMDWNVGLEYWSMGGSSVDCAPSNYNDFMTSLNAHGPQHYVANVAQALSDVRQNTSCIEPGSYDPSHRSTTLLIASGFASDLQYLDATTQTCGLRHDDKSTLYTVDFDQDGDNFKRRNAVLAAGFPVGCCGGPYCSPCDYPEGELNHSVKDHCSQFSGTGNPALQALVYSILMATLDTCTFKLDVSGRHDGMAPLDPSGVEVILTRPGEFPPTPVYVPHRSVGTTYDDNGTLYNNQGWEFTDETRTAIRIGSLFPTDGYPDPNLYYCAMYLGMFDADEGLPRVIRDVTTQVACDCPPGEGEFCDIEPTDSYQCTKGMKTCIEGKLECRPIQKRFKQVDAGNHHACGVDSNGSISCWGGDAWGSVSSAPTTGTYKQVSSGSSFSCAIRASDDAIVCWGSNDFGRATPPAGAFQEISVGWYHGCGIRTNGSIDCWGITSPHAQNYGQATDFPTTGSYTSISTGHMHSCAIRSDGRAVCWGHPSNLNPPTNRTFKKLGSGQMHTCGITTSGLMSCWGSNTHGQAPPNGFPGKFIDISSSHPFTCGLHYDGRVQCWGPDLWGDGHINHIPHDSKFVQISASTNNANRSVCGVRKDGTVQCWGDNTYGQLEVTPDQDACPVPCWQHANLLGQSCTVPGEFGRCAEGVYMCCDAPYVDAHGDSYCDGEIQCKSLYFPVPETCNGVDDDCDGVVDNIRRSWDKPLYSSAEWTAQKFLYDELTCSFQDRCECEGEVEHSYAAKWTDYDDSAYSALRDIRKYHGVDNTCQQVLSAGLNFSMFVNQNGELYGTRHNSAGQLGNGGTSYFQWTLSHVETLGSRVIAVSSGGSTTLALTQDGHVWKWGGGQTTLPERVMIDDDTPLNNVMQIAAGNGFYLALRTDGTVWSWGFNGEGQLGLGTSGPDPVETPQLIPSLTNITSIAVGQLHAMAIRKDGQMYTWGFGGLGQLGLGDDQDVSTPTIVPNLPPMAFADGSFIHTMAVDRRGNLYVWGYNGTDGHLGLGPEMEDMMYTSPQHLSALSPVISVAAGLDHSIAVLANGAVFGWGNNTEMKAGVFPAGSYYNTPQFVSAVRNGLHASTFFQHTSLLTQSGDVYEWGYRVCHVDHGCSLDPPYKVTIPGGMDCFAPHHTKGPMCRNIIAAGGYISSAIVSDGTVHSWGRNSSGELGTGGTSGNQIEPQEAMHLTDILALSNSPGTIQHSLALDSSGIVWAWGRNDNGQIGTGVTGGYYAEPTVVPGLTNVIAVSAGDRFSLALTDQGTVFAWGLNSSGQLGTGDFDSYASPMQVSGLNNVLEISAGFSHALAVVDDGSVRAWGNNTSGKLGIGVTGGSYNTPQTVSNLSGGVLSISAGSVHSLALMATGHLKGWGSNAYGRLGIGTTSGTYNTPIDVTVVEQIVAVEAAMDHSIALKADGTVWAWGYNSYGQVGLEASALSYPTPFAIFELEDIVAISATRRHNLALRQDGHAFSWGLNNTSQLGHSSGMGSNGIHEEVAELDHVQCRQVKPSSCECTEIPKANAGLGALHCDQAIHFGAAYAEDPASGVSVLVPYSGGNGGEYAAIDEDSYGVTGLNASAPQGTLLEGDGAVFLNITGTAAEIGTASFDITVADQSCTLDVDVAYLPAEVEALHCANTIQSATVYDGLSANGVTLTIPYDQGNGGYYEPISISSSGTTGLTAQAPFGQVEEDNDGNLVLTLSGVPSSWGQAVFDVDFGGHSCSVIVEVQVPLNNGDVHGGGIVYHTYGDGAALVVNTYDLGATNWGCSSTAIPGTTTTRGTGDANTAAILSGCAESGIAARSCDNLLAGGYSDWHLPTSGDMTDIYFRVTSDTSYGGFIQDAWYWSSRDHDTTTSSAWAYRLTSPQGQTQWKNTNNLVRCTRYVPPSTPPTPPAEISSFNCGGISQTGTLYEGVQADGVSIHIPYSGGNGGAFQDLSFSSTNVTGLTATAWRNHIVNGSGQLTLNITGTPSTSGEVKFEVELDGKACHVSIYSRLNMDYGDLHAGGILFYEYPNADSLVVTTIDQDSTSWGCVGTSIPTNDAIGSGQTNTNNIMNNCGTAGIAARTCNNLTLNGYNDWYLPSRNELTEIYNNLVAGAGYDGFISSYYYSSSQSSSSYARSRRMSDGNEGTIYKSNSRPLRCIRFVPAGTPPTENATITGLQCGSRTIQGGPIVEKTSISGITVTVPYTGGNGGSYNAISVNSTGVTGLTASAPSGYVANGSGNLVLDITGQTNTYGTAYFALSLGGLNCSVSVPVNQKIASATLDCANATYSGLMIKNGSSQNASISIPYSSGNGGYLATQNRTSYYGGLNGYRAGSYINEGGGTITLSISGTPSYSGTDWFLTSLGQCYSQLNIEQGIRDSAHGGIIYDYEYTYWGWPFYTWVLRKEIVGMSSPSKSDWGCSGTNVSTDFEKQYSASNTNSIINAGCAGGSVANACSNSTSGGFSNWALPSYYALTLVRSRIHNHGLGGFSAERYWSSSQEPDNASRAVASDFSCSSGCNVYTSKNNTYWGRCVRMELFSVGP